MKKIFISLTLLIFSILISENVKPNDLKVSNIALKNKNTVSKSVYVVFDIEWDNSWRLGTGAENWDAAWLFIKYRYGEDPKWHHATLSTEVSSNLVPSHATMDVSNDGIGAFLYRSEVGSGKFIVNQMQLKWLYGQDNVPDTAQNINIKVFGIEMVYVNRGAFFVGDGISNGRFWDASKTESDYALIGEEGVRLRSQSLAKYDDDLTKNVGVYVLGTDGISYDNTSTIDNTLFPTGFKAFYCMKHEITNEQYAEFLNTLTRSQQQARTLGDLSGIEIVDKFPMNKKGVIDGRNCIQYSNPNGDKTSPVYFFCNLNENSIGNEEGDGQDIPVCNLGWPDGCAYADWAGLRPMTELEFEKACIGPEIPIPYGYAWHTDKIYGDISMTYQYVFGATDSVGTSTSYPTNPAPTPSDIGNAQYRFTTGHETNQDSPLRVGMFGTASSDRVSSGASYYGILDLSGTISERTVTIAIQEGREFQGSHGDGVLSVEPYNPGDANNEDWPGYYLSDETKGVVLAVGSGYRGGDWNDARSQLTVAFRGDAAKDVFVRPPVGLGSKWISSGQGHIGAGFRGVRTADK